MPRGSGYIKVTQKLFETLRVYLSTTSETTNIPIHKKAIKDIKAITDLIVDLKNKINEENLDKRNLLRAHEDDYNSLQYQFHKYNENKHYAVRN